MRKWLIVFVIVFGALLVSTAIVRAQDTSVPPPVFHDGRLNAYDIAAPVVVYYTHETIPAPGWNNFRVIDTGIELYRVAGNAVGQRILRLTAEELNAALEEGITDFESSVPGFELHIGSNGWMSVNCPCSGNKLYTYSWDDNGRLLSTAG